MNDRVPADKGGRSFDIGKTIRYDLIAPECIEAAGAAETEQAIDPTIY